MLGDNKVKNPESIGSYLHRCMSKRTEKKRTRGGLESMKESGSRQQQADTKLLHLGK